MYSQSINQSINYLIKFNLYSPKSKIIFASEGFIIGTQQHPLTLDPQIDR